MLKKELEWHRMEYEDGEFVGRICVPPNSNLVLIETKDYMKKKYGPETKFTNAE